MNTKKSKRQRLGFSGCIHFRSILLVKVSSTVPVRVIDARGHFLGNSTHYSSVSKWDFRSVRKHQAVFNGDRLFWSMGFVVWLIFLGIGFFVETDSTAKQIALACMFLLSFPGRYYFQMDGELRNAMDKVAAVERGLSDTRSVVCVREEDWNDWKARNDIHGELRGLDEMNQEVQPLHEEFKRKVETYQKMSPDEKQVANARLPKFGSAFWMQPIEKEQQSMAADRIDVRPPAPKPESRFQKDGKTYIVCSAGSCENEIRDKKIRCGNVDCKKPCDCMLLIAKIKEREWEPDNDKPDADGWYPYDPDNYWHFCACVRPEVEA